MPQFLRTYVIELAFLAIIAGIYLLNLDLFALGSASELLTLQSAREAVLSAHWITPYFNASPANQLPPLMTWMSGLAFALFGTKLIVGRLLAVVLSLASLSLTYMLGLTLFRNRLQAIFSAMILATSWGFFRLSHYATSDIAYLVVLEALFLLLISWLPPVSGSSRRRSIRNSSSQLSLLVGIALGLAFLLQGLFGILLPVLIFGAYLLRLGSFSPLGILDVKTTLLASLVLILPWLTLSSALQGNLQPFSALTLTPLFHPGEALQITGWDPLRHFKNLPLMLMPWLFFIMALLLDREQIRSLKDQNKEPLTLLFLWLVLGFLAISLIAGQSETDILLIFPPFALLAGLYAGHHAQSTGFSGAFRWAVDLGIITLMMGAIMTAVLFFQVLPDTYAVEFWSLPGKAVLTADLHDLDLVFPLWKLWMIPGPLILLFGGVALYIFRVSEKPQAVMMTLIITFLAFFAFLKGLALPMLQRPVLPKLAVVTSHLATTRDSRIVIYSPALDSVNALFYLSPTLLPAKLDLNRNLGELEDYLQKRFNANSRTFGLMRETDFYALDLPTRQNLRLLASNWIWDAAQRSEFLKALRNAQPDFDKLSHRIILFEVLNHATVDAPEDPAVETENLERPVDSNFSEQKAD